VTVTADGVDEVEAVNGLKLLVASSFDEQYL